MIASEIEERFFVILSSLLNRPRARLGRDSSRETVEAWDSLKHMHLVLALEEEFNVEFSDREVAELASARALLDSISSKVAA